MVIYVYRTPITNKITMTVKFTSSLRRGRLRLLLWALTFLLMPQSLMADNDITFTVTESTGGYDKEGPDKAIDGITTNKWCGDFKQGNPYIVFKPECKAKLEYYYLYTGNDNIALYGYNRNPKEWKLYAKENAEDAWTEISHVTDAQLPTTKSTQSDVYTIDEEFQDTYYKFFKFEIMKVGSGSIFEVGELCLMGNSCQHQYSGDSAICSICLEIKEHEHIYGESIVIREPTCITSGTEAYICSRCREAITKGLPSLGHDYNDYIVTKAPTCTVTGEKEHTCKRCGDTRTEKIKPLGHTTNEDLICNVCGHDIHTDCIIEYTATKKLSMILRTFYEDEEGQVFEYTDPYPFENDEGFTDWGTYLFGAQVTEHEYDEATQKGRITCSTPVQGFLGYTDLHPEYLTSITLPSSANIININGEGFLNSSNLTSITLLANYTDEGFFDLDFYGCNNLQEIIVPYTSYEDYVKACEHYRFESSYRDDSGHKHTVDSKDLLKSLLTLDDTKTFQSPTIEVKADATLQRSFANDGWYSLCLPFSVSAADTPFSQVAAYSNLDGDTYRFTTVDNIEAGKAYIVKVNAAVVNPTFKNVVISPATPASDGDFVGVYSPTELVEGSQVIGSGSTVNPVNQGMMNGFRAYFPASAVGAKTMHFTVDGDIVTSISLPTGESWGEACYNLQGQRVNASHRGIVIKNDRKQIRK